MTPRERDQVRVLFLFVLLLFAILIANPDVIDGVAMASKAGTREPTPAPINCLAPRDGEVTAIFVRVESGVLVQHCSTYKGRAGGRTAR